MNYNKNSMKKNFLRFSVWMCLIVGLVACNGQGKTINESSHTADSIASNVVNRTSTEADSTGYLVKVGEMAPDFTVTLTDGKQINLSTLRGKVVMLQFTASWCGVWRKIHNTQNDCRA